MKITNRFSEFTDLIARHLKGLPVVSKVTRAGVDDPLVAGDAMKRDLAACRPPLLAAWLGPTRLAAAMLFATITKMGADLPLLFLTGDTGRFLWSLPVVVGCSLVTSRVARGVS